jgi:hypothetical protein
MTHYTMDRNFIASCGCTADSTHYPTAGTYIATMYMILCPNLDAAMSERAYGSSNSYGPACGQCFNLTLQNTYTPDPPFLNFAPTSIVIKVTDHCRKCRVASSLTPTDVMFSSWR